MPPPTQSVASPDARTSDAAVRRARWSGSGRPKRRDRVADGDGAAVDVHLGGVEVEVAHDALRDWAAKASLDSTRSRSARLQPAFSKRPARWPGIGPVPAISGSTAAWAQGSDARAGGVKAAGLGVGGAHQHQRHRSHRSCPEALAAVTEPSLVKAGLQAGDDCRRSRRGRMYSSWSTTVSPLRPLIVTRRDLGRRSVRRFWAASAVPF